MHLNFGKLRSSKSFEHYNSINIKNLILNELSKLTENPETLDNILHLIESYATEMCKLQIQLDKKAVVGLVDTSKETIDAIFENSNPIATDSNNLIVKFTKEISKRNKN